MAKKEYLAFCEHESPDVRAWALRRVARLQAETAPRAGRAAGAALASGRRDLAGAALDVLAAAAPDADAAALRAFARRADAPEDLRRRAVEILGRAGEPAADIPRAGGPGQGRPGPRALRRRAARLGEGGGAETRALLDALAATGRRWAVSAILARMDALMRCEWYAEAWDALGELGDPTALDAAIAEWRPGEIRIARTAALLAAIAGRLDALPDPLRADADEARATDRDPTQALASAAAEGGDAVDVALSAGSDSPLVLPLACEACGRVYRYHAGQAVVHPALLTAEGACALARRGWDGVLLWHVVRCKDCGAEDRYRLTDLALARLLAEAGAVVRHGREPGDGLVKVAAPRLWDGSEPRRAGEALRRVREIAEARPDSGDAWRRLGNLSQKAGLMPEAEQAWRRAVEVAQDEAEAAYSLAEWLWHDGRPEEALRFARLAVQRFPRGSFAEGDRPRIAVALCDLLRGMDEAVRPLLALAAIWEAGHRGDQVVLHASAVRLCDVSRWDRLAEFIAGEAAALDLAQQPVEDRPSILERWLLQRQGPQPPAEGAAPGAGARSAGRRVHRDQPCPCGSRRKYKRCCGPRAARERRS